MGGVIGNGGGPTSFIVGAPGDPTIAANAGAAYLFTPESDTVQQTYIDTDPAASDELGTAIALLGPQVLIGAPGKQDGALANAGAVSAFDINSGTWLRTVRRSTAVADERFGTAVGTTLFSTLDSDAVVGGSGSGDVALVDPFTGAPIVTFNNPTGAAGFGSTVFIGDGNWVFVSSPNDGTGKVYLFDGTTGAVLSTFVNPDTQGARISEPACSSRMA